MRINIVYNNKIAGCGNVLETLKTALIQKKVDFKDYDISNMENYGNFTFVIGGDGTLLKAARFYSTFKTPVLGINLGRLGFLSQTDTGEIDNAVQKVLDGYCNIKGSSWFAPSALRDRVDIVNDIYEKRLKEQCSPIVNKYYNSTLEYFSSDEIKKYLDELEEQAKRYKYTPSLWKKICEVKSIYEEKLKIEKKSNSWW